jgi:hypothetical protein
MLNVLLDDLLDLQAIRRGERDSLLALDNLCCCCSCCCRTVSL